MLTGVLKRALDQRLLRTWFASSKIRDASGKPLLMFHGTYVDFDSFADSHVLHCFTPDPLIAEELANGSYDSFKGERERAAIIIMPVYIRAQRPFDPRTNKGVRLMKEWGMGSPSQYDYAEWEQLEDLEAVAKIRANGFDGIWMRSGEFYNYLAIFSPFQVKSAIGNSGRFDLDSASLTDMG